MLNRELELILHRTTLHYRFLNCQTAERCTLATVVCLFFAGQGGECLMVMIQATHPLRSCIVRYSFPFSQAFNL